MPEGPPKDPIADIFRGDPKELIDKLSTIFAWSVGIIKPDIKDATTLIEAGVQAGKIAAKEDGFGKLSPKEQAARVMEVFKENANGEFNAAHQAIGRASGDKDANKIRILKGIEEELRKRLSEPKIQSQLKAALESNSSPAPNQQSAVDSSSIPFEQPVLAMMESARELFNGVLASAAQMITSRQGLNVATNEAATVPNTGNGRAKA